MSDRCSRCDFRGDLQEHAEEAEHPICYVCNRQSLTDFERQTCAKCIARTRANLADIESLFGRLEGYLIESRFPANSGAEIRGSGDDEQPIADALVMLAWGGAGWDAMSRRGNREHIADELDSDPQSVPGLLAVHEDDWRVQLRDPAAGPPMVASSVDYLNRNLSRMAQSYSEFDTFAQDIHNLRSRIRTAIGLSERPVEGANCFDCGEQLVRRYRYKGDQLKPAWDNETEPGLEDRWTCEKCGRVYEQAEYMLAVRSHHADNAAAEWRRPSIAAYLVDRPVRTIQTWMNTLEVAVACRWKHPNGKDADRRLVVWMPDVTELARQKPRRNRREAS
jgi:hypothetical protein